MRKVVVVNAKPASVACCSLPPASTSLSLALDIAVIRLRTRVHLLAPRRISKVHHILALLVKEGLVEKLWLRRQLTEEDKDELLHDPLTCYPSPFPRDNLMLTDAGKVTGHMVLL